MEPNKNQHQPNPTTPPQPYISPQLQSSITPGSAPNASQQPTPVGQPMPAPTMNPTLASNPSPTRPSGIVTGGIEPPPGQTPAYRPPGASDSKARSKKKLLLGIIALLIILGLPIFYFGYWNNPSVILSQSMKRSGDGLDKLITYVDQQTKVDYKGYEGNGIYKLIYGGTRTDGNVAFKSYGGNSQTNFDLGLGVTRIKAEVRTIKVPSSDTPDLYFKGKGIKGLGSITGSAEIDKKVNSLDGKWIVVDHTLFDNLAAAGTTAEPTSQPLPTQSDIVDALHKFNEVNKQYLFSTGDKAVTTVVVKKGKETIDGHKLYRYTMAPDKTNMKAYLAAQQQAIVSSKLGVWLKKNGLQDDFKQYFTDLKKSADKVKSSATFDLWVDTKTRLVYKIRFSDSKNPATNYTELGLDYKGGTEYPFFITGKSKVGGVSSTGTLVLSVNSKDNSVGLKLGLKESGSSGSSFTGDFKFKPSSKKVQILVPKGAESISQVFSELGFAGGLNGLAQPSSSQQDLFSTQLLTQ